MKHESIYIATVAGNPNILVRLHPTDDEMVESFGKVAGQHWHSRALVADIRPAAIIDSNGHNPAAQKLTTYAVALMSEVEHQWKIAK